MLLLITSANNVLFDAGKLTLFFLLLNIIARKNNTTVFNLKKLARRPAEICIQRNTWVCQEMECEKTLNVEIVSEKVQIAKN